MKAGDFIDLIWPAHKMQQMHQCLDKMHIRHFI